MNSANSLPAVGTRPELVFALVGAAGTHLDELSGVITEELSYFGYKAEEIRLSGLLKNFTEWIDKPWTSESERIKYCQTMGNRFRKQLKRGDALTLASIAEIQLRRAKSSQHAHKPATAYILNQLKHPDEVDLLRLVYGPSFLLIAAHAPKDMRIKDLAHTMARIATQPGKDHQFNSEASDVINIDEKEDDEFGQNVRDTYPKADLFVNLTQKHKIKSEVQRFVHLLFGHPFHTPSPDEYAMYHANAVSLRSSDDNRQVGAIIFSIDDPLNLHYLRKADVVAVGMNEVPRGGGGLYWKDASPDARDQALFNSHNKEDRANEIKIGALAELIEKIKGLEWFNDTISSKSASDLAIILLPNLKGTQFRDIGEFSRPVHAEMAALIDAARRGVAVDGHSMYVTTFPCHNCAKHIIASGIRRVVYLEPYPKSRAHELYHEEIALEAVPGKEEKDKVNFFAYAGIAPRQYQQLFSMSERGAKKGRSLDKWNLDKTTLAPLYVPKNASVLYLEAEREVLSSLPPEIYPLSSPNIS